MFIVLEIFIGIIVIASIAYGFHRDLEKWSYDALKVECDLLHNDLIETRKYNQELVEQVDILSLEVEQKNTALAYRQYRRPRWYPQLRKS